MANAERAPSAARASGTRVAEAGTGAAAHGRGIVAYDEYLARLGTFLGAAAPAPAGTV